MKLFACTAPKMTLTIIDLPRTEYRILPPRRVKVAFTLAGIAAHVLLGVISDLPKTLLKTLSQTMLEIQPAFKPVLGGV